MSAASQQLLSGLSAIRNRFIERLGSYYADVSRVASRPETATAEETEAALFALHKIAGTAAPLGFASLGADAKAAEDQLRLDMDGSKPASPSTRALLNAVCAHIERLAEEAA